MEIVSGHNNHFHCLFQLKIDQTIEKVLQLIKVESSFWCNKNSSSGLKLNRHKEYFADSISESQVSVVKAYIAKQEEYHENNTWERGT